MGQGVSRRGSYTPGQRDSELPVYDAENGDIRRDNKGSVKLVATVHKDDEGNAADAAALPTPDSSTSSPDKKKEKKKRFGFSLKKNASGKRRRKLNKEANGVRPISCPPALRAPDSDEEDGTIKTRRSHGIFKQGVDDITEETEHDQTVDTVSLSSNDEKEKSKHEADVKVKKKKDNHQKSKTPKKKEKTVKAKAEKRKSDSVVVVSSRQLTDSGLAVSTATPANTEKLLAETTGVTGGELSVTSLSRDTPAVPGTDRDHPSPTDVQTVRIPTDEEHKTFDLSSGGQELPCAVEIVECQGLAAPGLLVETEVSSQENVGKTPSLKYEGILGFPMKETNQKDGNEQSLQASVWKPHQEVVEKVVVGFEADENGEDWKKREGGVITSPWCVETKQDEQQLTWSYSDTQQVPENVALPSITGEAKAGKIKDEQISSHFIAGEIKEHVTLPFIAAQSKEEEQQITAHFIADETKEEQNMFLPFIANEVKQDSEIITLPVVSIDTKKDQNKEFLLVSGERKKQQGPTFTLPFIGGETKVEEQEADLPSITSETEKAGAMGTLPFIAVETRETFALPFVVDDHQKEEPMVTLPSVAMETEKEEHKISLPLVVDEPKQEGPRVTSPFIAIETKDEKQKISLPSGYIAMETKEEKQEIPLSFVATETEKGHQKISLPSVAREPRQEEPMITLPFIDMDTKEDEQQISFSLVATETKEEKQKISLPLVVDEHKQEGPRVTLPFITMETKEDQKISLPFAGGEHKQEEPKVSLPFVAMETKEEERKISLPFVAIETEKEEQRISLPSVACEAKQEGPRVTLPFITTETKHEKQISLPSGYVAMETKEEKQISLPSGYVAMETKEEKQISLPSGYVAMETKQEKQISLPSGYIAMETKEEEQKISLPSVAGETNQEKAKTMLCDVTHEAKQKVKQVTVITVEKAHLPQRLDIREEKREAHKSEADIVPHTATTSQKELVDTSLRTEVSPMKFHVQADTPGPTTELQEVQENILPQATVGVHGSHPEVGHQKMKEHVAETTETTSTPLSPAQLRAREKEMKALKKKEEKAKAKAAKDEKKRLKEEKKREAKEKKTKEKGKLTEIEVTVKIIEEPKTEMDDGLIVPLTAAEESTRFRSSAIFGKPNEVAQETFTVAQTVRSSHAPPSDFEEEPTEPVEEPLTVAQTVKLEAAHVSPAIVAELGSPQGEDTRQTEAVIGPNSEVGDKVMSLGFHVDDIISSIESSVIKVDESLQTKRKDEKPDGRPPDLPESPYPDDDTLETPKVDQVRDNPMNSLSDVSDSLSASWGETDWTPYIRLSPRTKEAVRSPETGEASGSPLKKIELGPRLRTAILRRSTGEVRMSEVKRVNLTKPRSVDTLATTPPSRRQRPRRPGEQVSSVDNRDNSSLSVRSSCGASIQYHPASLSPACDSVDGQEETRETLPEMPLEQLATSEDEERSGEQKTGDGSERSGSTTSDGSNDGDLFSGELFVSTLQVVVTSSQEVDGLGSQVALGQSGTTLSEDEIHSVWRPTSGQEGDLHLIEGAEDTAEGGDTYREVYVIEGGTLGLSSFVPTDSHPWNDADDCHVIPEDEAGAQVTGGKMRAQDVESFQHLRKKTVDVENSSDGSSDSDDAADEKGSSHGASDSDDVTGSTIAGVTVEVTESARACRDREMVEQTSDTEKGEKETEKDGVSVTTDCSFSQTLSYSHQSGDTTCHGDTGLVPLTFLASDTNAAHDSGTIEESCGQASGAECCGQACGQACGTAEETRELPGNGDVGSTCSGVSGSPLPDEGASAASSSPHGASLHGYCLLPDMLGDTKTSERLEANNNVSTSTGASIKEEGD